MYHVCLCYAVMSVPCSLVITCWERADLLTLLCVMFPCVFVTFPYGVPGQVWYLIVTIPDLCLLLDFVLVFIGIAACFLTFPLRIHEQKLAVKGA